MFRTSLVALLVTVPAAVAGPRAADAETLFEARVRPVLAGTCFRCHGGQKTANGLRVDSRDGLLKGGKSGPAIVPGDPDKSLLVKAIRHSRDDLRMPPGKKLPDIVAADFAAWVKAGAVWPGTKPLAPRPEKHWAFEPVRRVPPPPDPSGWAETPIDCFILAKLREQGLRPVTSADRRTLLRRVYFDLIGLPPTPEEIDVALSDKSPDWFTKVVDRLLASPHYGERWGRHWLDVARYADTGGDNADYPIPEARLYRDYVIDSFNADKPYDEFVREQLAGDILARDGPRERYAERIVATGFLALSRRYATAPYELWPLTVEDAIDTTGRAFLGLTLRCARCHDHKFDPVTQADYYALYGIFAATQFPWAGGEEFASMKKPRQHFVPLLPPDEAGPRLAAHQKKLRRLEEEIKQLEKANPKDAKLAGLRTQLANLRKTNLPPDLPGAYAVQEGKPAETFIHLRGDETQRGRAVQRGAPKFLCCDGLSIPEKASGRLQLAEWITRPDNPLPARVMVNRIWQYHFGKGLVVTPSNFGTRGELPTHPELLDWLASEFTAIGGVDPRRWSVKRLHRLLLLSKTYQLSSAHDETCAAKDPDNRWLWRYDRRRLDAEAIRDAMLAVSGRLDRRRPGPHPFPPMDHWAWTQHVPFKEVYPTNHRSVYLMTQRFQRHPYLALFDGPDTNTTTAQRTSSTVPQQALFLMNSPFVREQAEGFARRLIATTGNGKQRVELAYRLAWGRPASAKEADRGVRYVEEYQKELAKAGALAERRALEAWTSLARVLLSANEFAYLE